MPDPCLAIEAAMTEEQRQAFLGRFYRLNPHWRGARVADILDELDNADANLEVTEPFFERHSDLLSIPAAPGRGHPAALAVLALHWSGDQISPEAVRSLLARAGLDQ